MQRFVDRFKVLCTLIVNRPQSLTGHIVKRYPRFEKKSIVVRF
jgi:hypothetical protein